MFSIYKFSEVHALILRILIIYGQEECPFYWYQFEEEGFPSLVLNIILSFWKAFFSVGTVPQIMHNATL